MWRLIQPSRGNGLWDLLRGFKHLKAFIDRFAQRSNGRRATAKATACQKFYSDATISQRDQNTGNQFNLYRSIHDSMAGTNVKIDEWRGVAVSKPWTERGICGRLFHGLLPD
jgi:hypothetical protein